MRSSFLRTYGAYTELGSIAEAMSAGDSLTCGGRKRSQGISSLKAERWAAQVTVTHFHPFMFDYL